MSALELVSAATSKAAGSDGESVKLTVEELKTKRRKGVKVAFFTATIDWLVNLLGEMADVMAAKKAETLGVDASALMVPPVSEPWPLRPFVHRDADVALFVSKGRASNSVRLTDTSELPEGGRDWASAKTFKALISPMDVSKAGWAWVVSHGNATTWTLSRTTIDGIRFVILSHLSPERMEARLLAEAAAAEKAAAEKAATVHASKK